MDAGYLSLVTGEMLGRAKRISILADFVKAFDTDDSRREVIARLLRGEVVTPETAGLLAELALDGGAA
jgi:hypothetical protein